MNVTLHTVMKAVDKEQSFSFSNIRLRTLLNRCGLIPAPIFSTPRPLIE